MREPSDPFEHSRSRIPIRSLALFAAAVALFGLALAWQTHIPFFQKLLFRPYPYVIFLQNYEKAIADFPKLLFVLSAWAACFSMAFFFSRKVKSIPIPKLSPSMEWLLLFGFAFLNLWLSHRHYIYWGEPLWDNYWRAGEILHHSLRIHTPEVVPYLQEFIQKYPHSPSMLTPAIIALLMFLYADSVLLLQILSFAATIGALLLLKKIVRVIEARMPFWPIGLLFIANASVARSCFFIQLDGINGFFVLLSLWQWGRWKIRPTRANFAMMCAAVTLSVFQKTTLFPLMAIPALAEAIECALERKWNFRRLFIIGFWTALVPFGLFLLYCRGLGILGNFGTQVELMGAGWNEMDHAPGPFFYSTLFLIGPYFWAMFQNEKVFRSPTLGYALYVILFFVSLFVVRGPFWGRYYAHVVGACVVLSVPALYRMIQKRESALVFLVYLAGAVVFWETMLYWALIR